MSHVNGKGESNGEQEPPAKRPRHETSNGTTEDNSESVVKVEPKKEVSNNVPKINVPPPPKIHCNICLCPPSPPRGALNVGSSWMTPR